MLWLYLHFPSLQLDHYVRSQDIAPPLALVDGYPPHIESVNRQAQEQGVQPGQSLNTAICLAADLQILHCDSNLQARVLQQLAHWCYQYASPISLWAPDGLVLEVSGMRRLHGSTARLWQCLTQGLERQGFQVQAALGLTPRMARLLAHAGAGLCTEEPDRLQRQLNTLPISQAELPGQICERLQRMGLQTLDMLLALPARELARRLDPEAIDHLQRLSGHRADPRTYWSPPSYFLRRSDFILEAEQVSVMLFPLQRMIEELAQYLLRRQQATDTLVLKLLHRDRDPTALTIRTAAPEHRQGELMQLCRLSLDRHRLSAPVVALELQVERFLDRPSGARDLFGTPENQEEALHTLISRLRVRLGENAVRFIQSHDDHRPEKGMKSCPERPRTRVTISEAGPGRPLWLLRCPQPLLETPRQWLEGPERIDAGWWDGEAVQRDYYVAELTDHRLAWIFRNNEGAWYLHGWFG